MILREVLIWMVISIFLVLFVAIFRSFIEPTLWSSISIILVILYTIAFITRLVLLLKDLKEKYK